MLYVDNLGSCLSEQTAHSHETSRRSRFYRLQGPGTCHRGMALGHRSGYPANSFCPGDHDVAGILAVSARVGLNIQQIIVSK
jgi:hypothetical protein